MLPKVLKSFAVALCALLWAASLCMAADLVAVPRATSLLVDQARLLTDTERASIEARLQEIQASGRAQVGVLISQGTGDEPVAAYALRVAEAWGLGQRHVDNGLLILIVPSQNAARIEVGYGLEGDIPDLRAAPWVREFLQRSQGGGTSPALNALLDHVVEALPPASPLPRALHQFVQQHTDWKLPLVMLVLSVFTLFPLLFASVMGGPQARAWPASGTALAALVSGCLFAAVLGFAAKAFWGTTGSAAITACIALMLPPLWSLNVCSTGQMSATMRGLRMAGHLGLFAYIFVTLTLLAGAVLVVENQREVWMAPLLGLLFAAAPLVFLLGGRLGAGLMKLVGCYLYFLVALAITYFALQGVLKDPTATAFTVAGVFALLIALGLTLDDRSQAAGANARKGRWGWVFAAAAVLFLLPFMLVALAHALTGDAFGTHFAMLMAGDSSFSQFMWWASGALGGSALLVGLGGRFGGGGAGS